MKFIDLGLISYNEALEKQMSLLEEVSSGASEEVVVLCSHPPVVTLGRAFKGKDQTLMGWPGDVVETTRGGKATYHGPSQVIIYPILNLNRDDRSQFPQRDLHAYLRSLEVGVIAALKELGIEAYMRETPKNSPVQMTGVWVAEKKVASIGVAVKRWTTYHGVAINLDQDPLAFTGISPCGFNTEVMTSVEEILGAKVNRQDFQKILKSCLLNSFS